MLISSISYRPVASNDRMVINLWIIKVMVVICFKILTQHFPERTAPGHETYNSEQVVPGPRFKPKTSQILSSSANLSPTTFVRR
jgi:hypothetical protein